MYRGRKHEIASEQNEGGSERVRNPDRAERGQSGEKRGHDDLGHVQRIGQEEDDRKNAVVEAPLVAVDKQPTEEAWSGVHIGQVEGQEQDREQPERPDAANPAVEGRDEHDGEPLGEHGKGKPGHRPDRTEAVNRQQRGEHERHGQRVVVPAAGDFDEDQGIPGVDEDPLLRKAPAAEHEDREQDNAQVAQGEEQFHRSGTVPQVRGGRKDRLHKGRIDRGDVLVVDARVVFIAQMGDLLAVRGVYIGIYAMELHSGVPKVPVDVVGKGRGTELQDDAAEDGHGQDEPEQSPVRRRTGPHLADCGDRVDDEGRGEGDPEEQQGIGQEHPRGRETGQKRVGVEQAGPQVPDGRYGDTGGEEQETGDRNQARETGRESVSRNGHV